MANGHPVRQAVGGERATLVTVVTLPVRGIPVQVLAGVRARPVKLATGGQRGVPVRIITGSAIT